MKGKIGILTYQDTSNFGATLQAFALCKYLLLKGNDAQIIDYKSVSIDKRENPQKLFLELKNSFSLKNKIFCLLTYKKRVNKYRNLKSFIRKNASLSQTVLRADLKKIESEYDYFLVGSDMVWNFEINQNDFSYLLDFISKDNCKYSYASSIGEEWMPESDNQICSLLNQFSKIGVRENQAKIILDSKINKDVKVVCDPTMLLTPEQWSKYIETPCYKNYVLVYFDDEHSNCLKNAIQYGKKNNLKVLYISLSFKKNQGYIPVFPKTIEEFLGLISESKAVFTASYHGMLFSIYFRRNLFWYGRSQSSRMNFLSEKLGLNIRKGTEVDFENISEIDYDSTFVEMSDFREESERYLLSYFEENV